MVNWSKLLAQLKTVRFLGPYSVAYHTLLKSGLEFQKTSKFNLNKHDKEITKKPRDKKANSKYEETSKDHTETQKKIVISKTEVKRTKTVEY